MDMYGLVCVQSDKYFRYMFFSLSLYKTLG